MRIKKINQSGNRVLVMLVQFLLLLGCLIYMDYLYITQVRREHLAAQKFVETQCFVMTKKLSTKGRFFRRYRADFLINYAANGAQYTRWVTGNGLDTSYISNSASQSKVLSNFADGKNYPCWYNAQNPEEVVLVHRNQWSSTLTFIIPGLVALMTFFFFAKNIFLMLLRARDKKNKF